MGNYKGFSSVELRRPSRSTFDLSHEKRISTRIGKITPILITETLPNDTFRGSSEVLVKLAPMVAPIFHTLKMYVHYFFVPNRLIWEEKEWEAFITGGRLGPGIDTPPVPPFFNIEDILDESLDLLDVGSLADYLGIPPIADGDGSYPGRTIDAMPFGAVYKCWYDYFRDRNYVADNDALPMLAGSQFVNAGNQGPLLYDRYRAWQHDYFNSALLTTQRGAEVLMPIQGTGFVNYRPATLIYQQVTNPGLPAGDLQTTGGNPGVVTSGPSSEAVRFDNILDVTIDNSEISINDLTRAQRLQMWMERNQLAGSRLNESIMAHFGRKTSDARLQRAEYLGGGKAVIQISEINTTAYSEDASSEIVPPGNPAGRGSTYSDVNSFSYNCEEWGFVVGLLSILPTTAYMQGLPRMFQNRNTFLDYPWPTLAHLGEQEVYDNEIYMDPDSMPALRSAQPLFGYQSRYADWKYISSSSHGDFRTTLDFWHLTQKFSSQPHLSDQFVKFPDELQDRIFNVSGVDTVWMYVYNKLTVKRSLPYFGTPIH